MRAHVTPGFSFLLGKLKGLDWTAWPRDPKRSVQMPRLCVPFLFFSSHIGLFLRIILTGEGGVNTGEMWHEFSICVYKMPEFILCQMRGLFRGKEAGELGHKRNIRIIKSTHAKRLMLTFE